MGNHSEVEGTYYPHVEHRLAAYSLMRHARLAAAVYKQTMTDAEDKNPSPPEQFIPPDIAYRSAMLSMAFAYEGYLNYAGLADDPAWEVEWESKDWDEKLSRLASINGFKVVEGRRPFQTIKRLQRFRSHQAHPLTVKVKKKGKGDAGALFAKATVDRHLAPKDCELVYQDMKAAIDFIESNRRKSTGNVWVLASTSSSTTTGSRRR